MTLLTRWSLFLATGISFAASAAAPEPVRPDALMRALTSEMLVETKIMQVFDFEHMTRIAVARNWRLASDAQQVALVGQFRTLLVRTYSSALSSYRDERIEYKPLRLAAGETDVLVKSVVRWHGAEPLSIDYDMESTPAGWKVYDVKIAGVSMVLTYRESFASAVRAGGIDGLIKSLSDKNRQNDAERDKALEVKLAPVLMLYSGGSRPRL
ncbi:MAG TPA: ABC transporter substrate-binding protein [Burkholderiales bacterium]|nr:ABC transporter substrate-binding protein [Burkholderiales bacterium]